MPSERIKPTSSQTNEINTLDKKRQEEISALSLVKKLKMEREEIMTSTSVSKKQKRDAEKELIDLTDLEKIEGFFERRKRFGKKDDEETTLKQIKEIRAKYKDLTDSKLTPPGEEPVSEETPVEATVITEAPSEISTTVEEPEVISREEDISEEDEKKFAETMAALPQEARSVIEEEISEEERNLRAFIEKKNTEMIEFVRRKLKSIKLDPLEYFSKKRTNDEEALELNKNDTGKEEDRRERSTEFLTNRIQKWQKVVEAMGGKAPAQVSATEVIEQPATVIESDSEKEPDITHETVVAPPENLPIADDSSLNALLDASSLVADSDSTPVEAISPLPAPMQGRAAPLENPFSEPAFYIPELPNIDLATATSKEKSDALDWVEPTIKIIKRDLARLEAGKKVKELENAIDQKTKEVQKAWPWKKGQIREEIETLVTELSRLKRPLKWLIVDAISDKNYKNIFGTSERSARVIDTEVFAENLHGRACEIKYNNEGITDKTDNLVAYSSNGFYIRLTNKREIKSLDDPNAKLDLVAPDGSVLKKDMALEGAEGELKKEAEEYQSIKDRESFDKLIYPDERRTKEEIERYIKELNEQLAKAEELEKALKTAPTPTALETPLTSPISSDAAPLSPPETTVEVEDEETLKFPPIPYWIPVKIPEIPMITEETKTDPIKKGEAIAQLQEAYNAMEKRLAQLDREDARKEKIEKLTAAINEKESQKAGGKKRLEEIETLVTELSRLKRPFKWFVLDGINRRNYEYIFGTEARSAQVIDKVVFAENIDGLECQIFESEGKIDDKRDNIILFSSNGFYMRLRNKGDMKGKEINHPDGRFDIIGPNGKPVVKNARYEGAEEAKVELTERAQMYQAEQVEEFKRLLEK